MVYNIGIIDCPNIGEITIDMNEHTMYIMWCIVFGLLYYETMTNVKIFIIAICKWFSFVNDNVILSQYNNTLLNFHSFNISYFLWKLLFFLLYSILTHTKIYSIALVYR